MSVWRAAKLVILLVVALVLTVGLARLFSGSEDAWIRAADGSWVAHGHPEGPPPSPDYQPPWTQQVLPLFLLAAFAGGLVAAAFLSSRAHASRENISQAVRFFGAVSIIAGVLAASLGIALAASVTVELGPVLDEPSAVLFVLSGLAGLAGLLAAQAYTTKKVLEAHYDLKRATALLQETVERLAAQGHE